MTWSVRRDRQTRRSVGWLAGRGRSVGRSVLIFEKGGKFHFHTSIRAIVYLCF